jgi:hypothetical protein
MQPRSCCLSITYPFDLAEVERLYTAACYAGACGQGIWFRLKNGVIYDLIGNRVRHRGAFERPVKGIQAIRVAEYVMGSLHGWQPGRGTVWGTA